MADKQAAHKLFVSFIRELSDNFYFIKNQGQCQLSDNFNIGLLAYLNYHWGIGTEVARAWEKQLRFLLLR